MSLSTLAGGLLTEAGALVLNCCCIVLDIVCDRKPCLRDWDCKYYPNCICINGRCEDAVRDSCPPGYTEIPLDDGSGQVKCIPNCNGEPCQTTDDCDPVNNPGCICVDGRCVPSSDAFFCIDGECQRGGDLEYDPTDPDRPKGPYPTYQACCMSTDEDGNMCGCGFACTDSCQCIPSEEQVDYESYQECRAQCCDPDDGGRCCYNEIIKDDQGNLISVEWYDCLNSLNVDCFDSPIEDIGGGLTRQITSQFTKGVDCAGPRPPGLDPNLPWGEGCPIPEYGACCIEDGNDVIDCIEETKSVCEDMPNRPGDFPQYPPGFTTSSKSSTWSDCFTRRNPILNEEFACTDCNGDKDCACENTERCTGQECSLCYDNDPTKRGTMVRAQVGVDRQIGDIKAGESMSYYIRNCTTDAAGNPIPIDDADRKAKVFIEYGCGDTIEQEISEEGTEAATVSGTVYVTGIAGNPEVQVCVTLERDTTFIDCGTCEVNNDIYPKADDPQFLPDGTFGQILRSPNVPAGSQYTYNDGFPNCLGGILTWVYEKKFAQRSDVDVAYESEESTWTLWQCTDGHFEDVTTLACTPTPNFTKQFCGGIPSVIGDGLNWSYSVKEEVNGGCEVQQGYDAFGVFPDIPYELPDEKFKCGGVPVTTLYNPLP